MKDCFIADLSEHQTVQSEFLVREKTLRARRNDPSKSYLALKLGDRTGDLEGRVWNNVEELARRFEVHDFIEVEGRVEVYQGSKQLSIRTLRRCEAEEVDPADFLPCTQKDVEQMYAEISARIADFRNKHLKALLESILQDPELMPRLKRAPAAMMMHHAYIGGLLEHMASLMELARKISEHYPSLDGELIEAGTVLHDLGKVYELDYTKSFGYSTRGRLTGHMSMALEILREKTDRLGNFPQNLRTRLEHMILSHHGEYEFGSPVLPAFPEALVLHLLDQIDSKLQSMDAQYERDRDMPGEWTGRNPALARFLLKPADRTPKSEDGPAAEPDLFGKSS